MKTIVNCIVGLICLYIVVLIFIKDKPSRVILKQCTDNRGLTSVIFLEGKDTVALDYLTVDEFKTAFK